MQSAICLSNWTVYPSEKKCFKYVPNSQSWDAAETSCISYNGHLAAVTSLQELSFVQKLCSQNNNGCWVGGRGFNSTTGVSWKWSDNLTYWNGAVAPRIPTNSSCTGLSCSSHNLMDLCTLVTNETYLMAQSCNTSHSFVCMLAAGMWLLKKTVPKLFLILIYSCATITCFHYFTTLSFYLWHFVA